MDRKGTRTDPEVGQQASTTTARVTTSRTRLEDSSEVDRKKGDTDGYSSSQLNSAFVATFFPLGSASPTTHAKNLDQKIRSLTPFVIESSLE